MKVISRKLFDRLFRTERDEALIEHDPRFWQRYFEAYGLVVRGIRDPSTFDATIREQLERDADLISFEMEDLQMSDAYQTSIRDDIDGDEMDFLGEVETCNTTYVLPDDDWLGMSFTRTRRI